MGRKGNWFSSIKKALSPSSKEKKSRKASKSTERGLETEKSLETDSSTSQAVGVSHDSHALPPLEDLKLSEVDNEQTKHALSVAVATAAAAEAAVPASQAAAEGVRLTEVPQYSGKLKEEVAAIRIQTAFRGYLARRALRALRGLVRLKTLVEGHTVKRQTENTLRCMQTLSRLQSQINSRRIRMAEENQALQRQILQKRAKELESLQMGEEWDDSLQSKEQIEAKLLNKYEAAMRRERALAYSFSHQQPWKKSSRPTNLLFMDPTNPQWGWSWLERWMAARQLETKSATDKDPKNDNLSIKSASLGTTDNEITKSYARHLLNSNSSLSSTPRAKTGPRKPKPVSPRTVGPIGLIPDDDSKSTFSVQLERNRRHSVGGSSIRDDESLGSSASVPSYMAPTHSAKAKTRTQSPLGPSENAGALEKGSAAGNSNAKKRLSFPTSPARPRRHSEPLAVSQNVANGLVS